LLTYAFSFYLSFNISSSFVFKLEEEGNAALLHHLLKVLAESTVFVWAFGLGCWLVVATVQARF
jgi:hypothetical protein